MRRHHKSIDNLCFGRKKLHRQAQIQEIYRPRCNTEPGLKEQKPLKAFTIPILRIPEGVDNDSIPSSPAETTAPSTPTDSIPSSSFAYENKKNGNAGVLGSLLKQTIKVTTASVGFRAASTER